MSAFVHTFFRHAVGGEYGAGWKPVGAGKLVTTFFPDDDSAPTIIEGRHLKDTKNVAVVYHNPLDNVPVGAWRRNAHVGGWGGLACDLTTEARATDGEG